MQASHIQPLLTDAQELKRLNPGRFSAPTADDIAAIAPGMFVKVCNHAERFWAIVEKVDRADQPFDTVITARVDNHLLTSAPYRYGDNLVFHGKNVYDINA
jgi:hypothetical protein